MDSNVIWFKKCWCHFLFSEDLGTGTSICQARNQQIIISRPAQDVKEVLLGGSLVPSKFLPVIYSSFFKSQLNMLSLLANLGIKINKREPVGQLIFWKEVLQKKNAQGQLAWASNPCTRQLKKRVRRYGRRCFFVYGLKDFRRAYNVNKQRSKS